MTDRLKGFIVTIKPMREDDAKPLMDAIRLLSGVVDVSPVVAGMDHHMAVTMARMELAEKLWAVLHPKEDNK